MKSTKLFLVFLNIYATLASKESPVTCASEGEACVIHNDSLLDEFKGVATVEECRQLCQDTEGCEYLTYFNASGDLFREVCYTFSSCEETYSCQNCASETEWCYAVCGKSFYGVIDNNLIDVVGDVDSESDCKDICISTVTCTYYTYFTEDDLHSKACVLLSSLMEPFQNCDTCLTGAVDCKGFGDCSLQYNGESHRSLMFTKPGLDINVTASPLCQLRVLAIGGGGSGGSGGGGSGYIQFYSETFTSDTFIRLTVGDQSQSSSVTVNGQTVTAAPGNSGFYQGTDGYSGGGGYGSSSRGCDGGTDGVDGEDCIYDGGHGTRDDVTAYMMINFVLTPGAGGQYYKSPGGYYYGGGGGGVLVNGEGPQREYDRQGEGYVGGGGLPGVILMEVEEN